MKPYLLVLAVAVGLSGCTLLDRQEKRINYTENLNSKGTPTLITDAKQRAIINVPANVHEGEAGDDGVKNHPTHIICAEPSPDVAQAISAAFTAAAEVDGGAQQMSGSGSIGSAYASSIAQLGERLATVALLRDKMYRACEAYQNGAITDTSYTLMLSRFDKTMTSLLSAEMAAGAFGRNLAALGGSASTGGVDPAKMQAAKEAVTTASAELQTAATKAAAEQEQAKRDEILAKPKADLEKAVNGLIALEYQAAQAAASSGPGDKTGVIGQIVGRSETDADAVARINANFLDDDASGSIIDACITALDRNRAAGRSPQDIATAKQLNDALVAASNAESDARKRLEDASPDRASGSEEAPPVVSQSDAQNMVDAQAAVTAAETQRKKAQQAKRDFDEASGRNAASLSGTCSEILTTANTATSPETAGVLGLLQQNKLALRNVEADIAKIQFAAAKANAEAEKTKIEGCMAAAKINPDAAAQAKLWECLGVPPKP